MLHLLRVAPQRARMSLASPHQVSLVVWLGAVAVAAVYYTSLAPLPGDNLQTKTISFPSDKGYRVEGRGTQLILLKAQLLLRFPERLSCHPRVHQLLALLLGKLWLVLSSPQKEIAG